MALDTLTVLTGKVRAVLRDSEGAFISDTNIKDWLNEGYVDICARLRLKQVTATGSTDSSGNLAFPSDFVELVSFFIDGDPVSFESRETFETWLLDGTATPEITLVSAWNNTFSTYPVQASKTYKLDYIGRPTLLSAGSDTPSALTEELTPRLWKYAASEAKRMESETDEADFYMNEYLEGLPGRPRNMYRIHPGPKKVMADFGPFDV